MAGWRRVDVMFQTMLLTLCLCQSARATLVTDEGNLRTAILTGYNTAVRPTTTVQVELRVVLLSLNELNIGQEKMSLTSIVEMLWEDLRLTWTAASYGNINFISIAPSSIWTPALVIENAVENAGLVGHNPNSQVEAIVRDGGEVAWYNPLLTTTFCSVKISKYPYDTQDCHVRFTGVGNSESYVNITFQPPAVLTTYYSENGEWDLVKTWGDTGRFDVDANLTFGRIDYYFRFRRKWQFYGLNLVMPIVLTSILMCAVFALPIESGEKMGFSLTVLLSYVVFLTWVTDNLPAVSTDTSVLQVYLALVLCLGVLATLLTTWVLMLYHRDNHTAMSSITRGIVTRLLAPLFSCTCCTRRTQLRLTDNQHAHNGKPTNSTSKVAPSDQVKVEDVSHDVSHETSEGKSRDGQEFTWQEVAAMFDHFFLYLFSVVMAITTVVILAVLYVEY